MRRRESASKLKPEHLDGPLVEACSIGYKSHSSVSLITQRSSRFKRGVIHLFSCQWTKQGKVNIQLHCHQRQIAAHKQCVMNAELSGCDQITRQQYVKVDMEQIKALLCPFFLLRARQTSKGKITRNICK